jgi:hypothetical protein
MDKGKTKLGTGAQIEKFENDGTLVGNSPVAVPTVNASKTYMDTKANTLHDNIVLNAFRIAVNGSLTQFGMVDGILDEYEDESGINTASSTDESYDSAGDSYSPAGQPGIKLLLTLDGADAAVATTDLSASAHVVTFNGNAQLDTAIKKFGTASLLLDGTGDYLSIPDSPDFDIVADNTSDYTIDMHVNHLSFSPTNQTYFAQTVDSNNNIRMALAQTGGSTYYPVFTYYDGGVHQTESDVAGIIARGLTLETGDWNHLALIKNGSFYGNYVEGVQQGYSWTPNERAYAADLWIGKRDGSAQDFNGNMDDFRIQADNHFSASPNSYPAASLLLYGEGTDEDTTMSNDGYSGAVTMVGGAKLDNVAKKFNATTSMFFDGASDYLSVVDTSGTDYDIVVNTTDSWTIDLWVKHTDHAGQETYLCQNQDASNKWLLRHQDGTGLQFRIIETSSVLSLEGGEITDTNWHHVSMVKVGSQYGIYNDGMQVAYVDDASVKTLTAPLFIGTENGIGALFSGFMEQIQITKANKFGIVPIPEPFTHMLLENNTDAGSGANAVTNIGTPTYTAGHLNNALTLDGSTDALNLNALATDVASDTTGSIAFWIKGTDGAGSNQRVFSITDGSDANDQFTIIYQEASGTGAIRFHQSYTTGSDRWLLDSAVSSVPAETWVHVVLVQDGVSPKVYINGVDATAAGSFLISTDLSSWFSGMAGVDTGRMGARVVSSTEQDYFNGQIDDFRYYQNRVLTQAHITALYNTGTGTEATFAGHNITVPTAVLTQDTITVPVAAPTIASNDMTLISDVFAAEAQSDIARINIFQEDVDAITLNTDLKAYVSRDNGTTYSQITLVNTGEYEAGKNLLSASVDISAQPAGTDMIYKLETLNAKNLKIHGTGLSWD